MTGPMAFSSRGSADHARRRARVESLMQSMSRVFCSLGFAAVALAAPVAGQRADDQILPKSVELQHQARDAIGAGKLEQAEDAARDGAGRRPAQSRRLCRHRPRRREAASLRQGHSDDQQGAPARAQRSRRDRRPGRSDGRDGCDRARTGEPAKASDHLRSQGLSANCPADRRDQPRPDSRFRQGARPRPSRTKRSALSPARPIRRR